jgi:hypothetical protein
LVRIVVQRLGAKLEALRERFAYHAPLHSVVFAAVVKMLKGVTEERRVGRS